MIYVDLKLDSEMIRLAERLANDLATQEIVRLKFISYVDQQVAAWKRARKQRMIKQFVDDYLAYWLRGNEWN